MSLFYFACGSGVRLWCCVDGMVGVGIIIIITISLVENRGGIRVRFNTLRSEGLVLEKTRIGISIVDIVDIVSPLLLETKREWKDNFDELDNFIL